MKTFKHFPIEVDCPLCGTNADIECTLIPIDGTTEGKIEVAKAVHMKCLLNLEFRFAPNESFIYSLLKE